MNTDCRFPISQCSAGRAHPKPGTDVVRFVGDQIAAVIAQSEAAAQAALGLIQVEYEDLPIVSDPLEAIKSDAPRVHQEIGDSNICVHYKIRKGDIEAGFAQADVIVEGEYRTPAQEHAYLQPEAGLSYIDEEGRVTIVCGGQWTHADRDLIAHALNLPEERVRVIYPAIGGAFGGREDLSVQIVLALATWKLQRPVKIIWSRREFDHRTREETSRCFTRQMGRDQRGKTCRCAKRNYRRRRRLHVHIQQSIGQLSDHLHRPLFHSKC